MEGSKAFEFYQMMKDENPVVFFTGVIRQSLLPDYANILKARVDLNSNSKMILLTIFIELAQNILRYSAEQSEGQGVGLIWVTEKSDQYRVHAGNLVTMEQMAKLQVALTEICALDLDGLKVLRKQRLNHAPPEGSKGAGLGLLEVQRRSMKPVEYAFIPYDNEHMFLSLSANVPRESI